MPTLDARRYGPAGLMEYRDSSGLWVPVTGTPATGKVATVQADGSVAWATPGAGGGSAPAWTTYHPDTPPSSGTSYDREYASGVATSVDGTTIGSPATAVAVVDTSLRVTGGTTVGFDVKGQEWDCPASGAFTVTARLRRKHMLTNYHIGLFALRASASGDTPFAGFCWFNNSGAFDAYLGYHRYATRTSRSATPLQTTVSLLPAAYARLRYDGTNLVTSFSPTGHPDSFSAIWSESAATAIGGAPRRILLGMESYNGSVPGVLYLDWLRVTLG